MEKIVDLIARCDESELFTQNLQENIIEWKVVGKNGQVTFLTDPALVYEKLRGETTKIPIVIWFPADVF